MSSSLTVLLSVFLALGSVEAEAQASVTEVILAKPPADGRDRHLFRESLFTISPYLAFRAGALARGTGKS